MSLRRSARTTAQCNSDEKESIQPNSTGRKRAGEPTDLQKVATKKSRKSAILVKDGNAKRTTSSNPPLSTGLFKVPVTPVRKRTVTKAGKPSLTPTPTLAAEMRAPYSSGDIDDATPPPLDRPVEPHVSNATLVTPGGTQLTAYASGLPDMSPSKTGLPRPTAMTADLLEKACAHLIKVDPKMKPIIEKFPCPVFSARGLAEEIDPFRSLSSGIIGQQVSGAAAKSIKNKFIGLFNEGNSGIHQFPTPAQVVEVETPRLRLAGLSQRKAEYIHGLAEKFVSGELSAQMLLQASDEEVMERLIAVRGLGKWSVEMFACFGLKRMDIFSTGDLGVQRGMAAYFGKDVKKLKAKGGGKWKYMSEEEMLSKSEIYAPYRSLFMWYMWRVEDVDVDVMQNGDEEKS